MVIIAAEVTGTTTMDTNSMIMRMDTSSEEVKVEDEEEAVVEAEEEQTGTEKRIHHQTIKPTIPNQNKKQNQRKNLKCQLMIGLNVSRVAGRMILTGRLRNRRKKRRLREKSLNRRKQNGRKRKKRN